MSTAQQDHQDHQLPLQGQGKPLAPLSLPQSPALSSTLQHSPDPPHIYPDVGPASLFRKMYSAPLLSLNRYQYQKAPLRSNLHNVSPCICTPITVLKGLLTNHGPSQLTLRENKQEMQQLLSCWSCQSFRYLQTTLTVIVSQTPVTLTLWVFPLNVFSTCQLSKSLIRLVHGFYPKPLFPATPKCINCVSLGAVSNHFVSHCLQPMY